MVINVSNVPAVQHPLLLEGLGEVNVILNGL